MSAARIAGIILGSAALVAGHGYVSGAVVDGQYYGGYIVNSYAYTDSPPETIGWSTEATDLGFVDGSDYSNADIICHKSAKPGAISAPVKAGGEVELQWTEWPESHHGPVITYLANCNGDCSSVDKTSLEFFKIDQKGLISDSSPPGTWASDNLISNNNSWSVTIPSDIAAGNYVLRHEIIALHSAGNKDGAQNYPQCLNLKVTGGGSANPEGTLGTALYKDTDPGIEVNIYQTLSSYDIPGPALYSGASSGSSSGSSSSGSSSSASAVPSATPSASASASASANHGAGPSKVTSIPLAASSTTTQYATSVQSNTATAYQTSTDIENVTVTASPPQQTQVQVPSASTTTAVASTTASVPTPSGSGSGTSTSTSSWSDYFDSLSAEQFLNLLSNAFSWMVTEKAHPRDISS